MTAPSSVIRETRLFKDGAEQLLNENKNKKDFDVSKALDDLERTVRCELIFNSKEIEEAMSRIENEMLQRDALDFIPSIITIYRCGVSSSLSSPETKRKSKSTTKKEHVTVHVMNKPSKRKCESKSETMSVKEVEDNVETKRAKRLKLLLEEAGDMLTSSGSRRNKKKTELVNKFDCLKKKRRTQNEDDTSSSCSDYSSDGSNMSDVGSGSSNDIKAEFNSLEMDKLNILYSDNVDESLEELKNSLEQKFHKIIHVPEPLMDNYPDNEEEEEDGTVVRNAIPLYNKKYSELCKMFYTPPVKLIQKIKKLKVQREKRRIMKHKQSLREKSLAKKMNDKLIITTQPPSKVEVPFRCLLKIY